MPCLWQGNIATVYWPQRGYRDLTAELWWSRNSEPQYSFADGVRLRFARYVRVQDVALFQICGPEVVLLSKDADTIQYFSELADVAAIALELEVVGAPQFDKLLVFLEFDGADARVVARPVDSQLTLADLPLAPALPSGTVPEKRANSPRPSRRAQREPAREPAREQPASPPKPAVADVPERPVNVRKTLQQTIMAGLRLRGIRSAHKDFKKLYYGILSLAEVALENAEPQLVTTTYIREKVEALLTIVE